MSALPPPPPAPGWYTDPTGVGQRYWDGTQWTAAAAGVTRPASRSSNGRTLLIIFGAVFALFAGCTTLAAIGSKDGTYSNNSSTTTRAGSGGSALTPAAPRTPDVAPAGSAVRDGKFEFQVLDVRSAKKVSDPTNNPYMTATAQGVFIVVTLSIRNIGNEAQNYFGANQKLIDGQGREYGSDSAASMYMNTDIGIMGEINPGNAVQAQDAFDVPPNTMLSMLELHDSAFSSGVRVQLPASGG